jgi:hypothetical protein
LGREGKVKKGHHFKQFNESGFWVRKCLYTGTVCVHPFISGVKTFQVDIWRNLKHDWRRLSLKDQASFESVIVDLEDAMRD